MTINGKTISPFWAMIPGVGLVLALLGGLEDGDILR